MKEEKTEKQSAKDIFAKLVYVFAKFSWFFGIIIALIVLLTLYRFIIQPQYQKILDRQEEIRQLNLEGERGILERHLVNLEKFITLSSAITEEEKQSVDKLLRETPDLLVLQIQFEKLIEKYNTQNPSVSFGEVSFDEEEELSDEPDVERERVIDLSSFFDETQLNAPVETKDEENPEVVRGVIPIDISVTFEDYYQAKDFISDLERLVPLVDFENISITISNSEEEADDDTVTEVPADDTEDTLAEEFGNGATELTLSGVIQVAKTK